MEEKILSPQDIELLERQGLIADIRNKLSNNLNLLCLLEESEKDTEIGRNAKKYLEEHQSEMVAASQKSLAHILSVLTHSEQLPWYKRISILAGKHM